MLHLYLSPPWRACYDSATKPFDLSPEDATRFWLKVKIGAPDACWEWTGRLARGYGQFDVAGRKLNAHRVAHQLKHGATSLHVLHSCDNPRCVNPAHLSAGRQQRNSEEMARKGRAKGQKLTEAIVLQIMALRARGLGSKRIGRGLGLNDHTVRDILIGRSWRRVTGWGTTPIASPNLDWSTVHRIRELHTRGFTYKEVAIDTGVNIRTVETIVRKKIWKEAP